MTTRTKSILIYVGGILTGIVLTFVALTMIGAAVHKDAIRFNEPQQEIEATSFQVFQVLDDGSALAMAQGSSSYGLVVMLCAETGLAYYDEQKIDVPYGKRAMQVGTYKYKTHNGMERTVPIVGFFDR
jgi:hypothetical protein